MVTKGWLRASHRAIDAERSTPYRPFHTHQNPEPLQPGRIYQFEIEVWPTSWVFKTGHRIRLELANGDSRVFDAPFGHHYGLKMGTDTIYHDAQHPSHVLLPVIPKRACPGSCSIADGNGQSD
jgi:predicted acyl esterase